MPAFRPDLVFALVGDVRLSSRALRQLRWLSSEGVKVEALTFGGPQVSELAPGVRLTPVERPGGRGPRFFWRAHRAFRAAARLRSAQVFHASDLFTLPAMADAAGAHSARLAFDARELYPHVDATAGKPWSRLLWSAVERRYIRRCDTVFTVNESIATRLSELYGIDQPVVVHNVAVRAGAEERIDLRERLGISKSRRIVLYQGLFNRGRGLEILVEAMASVDSADLVLIGEGPLEEALKASARKRLGERVHFLPFTPPDELAALTSSADVGVCLLEPITESVRLALPNKLFEYLAAGLPVVVSDMPEMAAVVGRFDVGQVIQHDDVSLVAGALREALGNDAVRQRWRNNIPAVFKAFDIEDQRRRFLDAIGELL